MKTYDLYVHSGPMRKKTYIHVPALPGCIAQGETTDAAITAAPAAITTYLRYLQRHGADVNADEAFRTRIGEMNMRGGFLGVGFLATDAKPLSNAESDRALTWLGWIHDDIRRVTSTLPAAKLQAKPAVGRPIHRILEHMCGEGGYLRGVKGASRVQREVEQGRLDPRDALDQLLELERERLQTMTAEERAEVRQAGQSQWSARAAVRRMLEHGWEHYVEICERLGVEP